MKLTIPKVREIIKDTPYENMFSYDFDHNYKIINRICKKLGQGKETDIFDKVYYYEAKRNILGSCLSILSKDPLSKGYMRFYKKSKNTENHCF